VTREDSDDELGFEDLPWQWIYDRPDQAAQDGSNIGLEGYESDSLDDAATTSLIPRPSRKRKHDDKSWQHSKRVIIGARMGDFECKVGDCVLLKADGTNEAWVGIICEFVQDEEEGMMANFMWFSTEKEIRNKEKKRKDFMRVCILYFIGRAWQAC